MNTSTNLLDEMEEVVHVLSSEPRGCVSQNAVDVLHLGWILVHLLTKKKEKREKEVYRYSYYSLKITAHKSQSHIIKH